MKWLIPFPCKECEKGSRCWHWETCARVKKYMHDWSIAVKVQAGKGSYEEQECVP